MTKIVDTDGEPLMSDADQLRSVDIMEAEELKVKITTLVRATFGYIPHPQGLNRKLKRRLHKVLRGSQAHKIAKAVRSKYDVARKTITSRG